MIRCSHLALNRSAMLGWPGQGRVRPGFALLAVLWMLMGAATIGLALKLLALDALDASRNRQNLARASWIAEGCLARARALIDDSLAAASHIAPTLALNTWARLDTVIAGAPLLRDCRVEMSAAGTQIDVNVVSESVLTKLLHRYAATPDQGDSLAAAILDWRDADNIPRPLGAEAEWYSSRNEPLPRNGPFTSSEELHRVRGYVACLGLDSLLGVEPGHILIDRAPLPILAALPGISPEAVALLENSRQTGTPIRNLADLAKRLDQTARDSLLEHYGELVRLTASIPDAWVLRSRAVSGTPGIEAFVEVRMVQAGSRISIVRHLRSS